MNDENVGLFVRMLYTICETQPPKSFMVANGQHLVSKIIFSMTSSCKRQRSLMPKTVATGVKPPGTA